MTDRNRENEEKDRQEGWRPEDKTGEEALKTEERSLDIGESGQHAPGGYYNQQGVNEPDRSTLDNS